MKKSLKETIDQLPAGCKAKREYKNLLDSHNNCIEDMEFYALHKHDETDDAFNIKRDVTKYNELLMNY